VNGAAQRCVREGPRARGLICAQRERIDAGEKERERALPVAYPPPAAAAAAP